MKEVCIDCIHNEVCKFRIDMPVIKDCDYKNCGTKKELENIRTEIDQIISKLKGEENR
jgi:hypothetical protein